MCALRLRKYILVKVLQHFAVLFPYIFFVSANQFQMRNVQMIYVLAKVVAIVELLKYQFPIWSALYLGILLIALHVFISFVYYYLKCKAGFA